MTRSSAFSTTKRARPVHGSATVVTWSCGVGLVGGFEFNRNNAYGYPMQEVQNLCRDTARGTGFVLAAFVNDAVCKAAYEAITKAHKLVFQSEVRINRNSGRDFFFIIYDTR